MSWFSGDDLISDTARGRQAVTDFHNYSRTMPNYSETSVDSLLAKIMNGKTPEFFLEGLGLAIREIPMSGSQVIDAMKQLALRSNGRIPTQFSFTAALTDRASNPTFVDYLVATPEIATGIAGDVVKGAQRVGDAVLDVAKFYEKFGPLLAVAAIGFIAYAYTRRVAGR